MGPWCSLGVTRLTVRRRLRFRATMHHLPVGSGHTPMTELVASSRCGSPLPPVKSGPPVRPTIRDRCCQVVRTSSSPTLLWAKL